jgi:hypothetical protein
MSYKKVKCGWGLGESRENLENMLRKELMSQDEYIR